MFTEGSGASVFPWCLPAPMTTLAMMIVDLVRLLLPSSLQFGSAQSVYTEYSSICLGCQATHFPLFMKPNSRFEDREMNTFRDLQRSPLPHRQCLP